MGKPTGFIEYERKTGEYRTVPERIKDYDEFLQHQNTDAIVLQAARCMDCGISFCHAGILVDGQSIGCPLNNPISETNDLVYRHAYADAYKRLRMTHPFPEFTSKVCPALCEGSCSVGEHGDAVTVKEIERFLVNYAVDNNLDKARKPSVRSGKRIAIVGSGPAGLAAADTLNQLGHEVTVFERNERAGGLMMFGIPNMKLDKSVIARRINTMQDEGIKFNTGIEAGIDISANSLLSNYDAIILAGGATVARLLTVPGSDLKGVIPAVRYLTHATRNLLGLLNESSPYDPILDAKDKDVVIIGGGDTGTDCVGTAIRQGAKSVVQIEIMPEASRERQANNPWPTWPRVLKTDYGQKEAIELFGNDPREYLTTVTEVISTSTTDDTVAAVKTVQVEWKNVNGKMVSEAVPGSEKTRPAQLVLIAMGFLGPEKTLIDAMGLMTDARSNIKTAQGSYQTNIPKVFSAGDMRRGQSLVVWALMEGIQAAKECHKWLGGIAN
ncbi:MAG: glutamate synthase subunit beta [Coriobacteriales bacterium]|jgi:glutamate synthase (NADPH/NADH) small chain|nr:glutamate synthase subunit beta [Coriobacteriales bacterium]